MTDGERKLLELIRARQYYARRLNEAKERLERLGYKTTASYGSTGGGSGSGAGSKSKVEKIAEKKISLQSDIEKCSVKLDIVDTALACASLSRMEQSTLLWEAAGGHLSSLAASYDIYQSRIYKIRDKAIRKAYEALKREKPRFEANFR